MSVLSTLAGLGLAIVAGAASIVFLLVLLPPFLKGILYMLETLKAHLARILELVPILVARIDALAAERDAALARVAELEAQLAEVASVEASAADAVAALEAVAA